MNYLQKQAALQKLAQVRLAINYVMRNRGMKKQAEPQFGQKGYIAPEWQWMKRFDEVSNASPNNAKIDSNGFKVQNIAPGSFFDIPERLSLPVGHPDYLSPNDPYVQRRIAGMSNTYNEGLTGNIDVYKHGSQVNWTPVWGVDSIMNAPTQNEKVRQGQNYLLNHGGEINRY